MKNTLITLLLFSISTLAFSQETMVSLKGGYAFAKAEESDKSTNGFRIDGLFEFNPMQGKIAHGFNIGYVLTSFEESTALGTTDLSIRNIPLYYQPKVFLGNSETFKPFLKGAVGFQFAKATADGPLTNDVETTDSGFYGGAGAGALWFANESLFLNIEYEWAYMANSFYNNGFLNSVSLGVGFKF